MTTSDKAQRPRSGDGGRNARIFVVVVIAGTLVFGGYVGYLAWTNDAFPAQQRPFSEYATVASAEFNGTELAFRVQWLRGDTLPLYAQLTSASADAANSPVCDVGITSIQAGQSSFMPFAVNQHLQAITDAQLSVAMKSVANGSEFTIVYSLAPIQATPGNILPSDVSCSQPVGVE